MALDRIIIDKYIDYPESAIMAKTKGVEFYFTGKKCSKGHISLRYASSSNCIKCIEEKRNIVFKINRGNSSKRSLENQLLAESAFNNGQRTYISKTKCKLGHYERFIGSNNCKECASIASRKRKNVNKWNRIKKQYNISESEYNNILKNQKNKCKICGKKFKEKNKHIDHCHKTNKVRGILCNKCNQAIGLLNEDVNILNLAIKYLTENK